MSESDEISDEISDKISGLLNCRAGENGCSGSIDDVGCIYGTYLGSQLDRHSFPGGDNYILYIIKSLRLVVLYPSPCRSLSQVLEDFKPIDNGDMIENFFELYLIAVSRFLKILNQQHDIVQQMLIEKPDINLDEVKREIKAFLDKYEYEI